MEQNKKQRLIQRLGDPINFREACYRFVWAQEYAKNYGDYDKHQIIQWLGSNVGQGFLDTVNEYIQNYPMKNESCWIYSCGELRDPVRLFGHYLWFVMKGKPVKMGNEFYTISSTESEIYFCNRYPILARRPISALYCPPRMDTYFSSDPTKQEILELATKEIQKQYNSLLNL